jgi:hypothetical protein
MLGSLIASAKGLESIDERMLQCGVSRRAFPQFCATWMITAPYGLAITDKKTRKDVAAGLGKVIRPPIIWLAFQDCTGCTESLLQTSHPDFGDLNPGVRESLAQLSMVGQGPSELIIVGVVPKQCEFANGIRAGVMRTASLAVDTLSRLLTERGADCHRREACVQPNLWWLPVEHLEVVSCS